jgi:hypothetical protein
MHDPFHNDLLSEQDDTARPQKNCPAASICIV